MSTKRDQPRIGIHFGAMSPKVSQQLKEAGLVSKDPYDLGRWDKAAKAITQLHLSGFLTYGEADKARKRLFKQIVSRVHLKEDQEAEG
jgi:hypothetical protein